jgi:hypothetical protein
MLEIVRQLQCGVNKGGAVARGHNMRYRMREKIHNIHLETLKSFIYISF